MCQSLLLSCSVVTLRHFSSLTNIYCNSILCTDLFKIYLKTEIKQAENKDIYFSFDYVRRYHSFGFSALVYQASEPLLSPAHRMLFLTVDTCMCTAVLISKCQRWSSLLLYIPKRSSPPFTVCFLTEKACVCEQCSRQLCHPTLTSAHTKARMGGVACVPSPKHPGPQWHRQGAVQTCVLWALCKANAEQEKSRC